MKKLVIAFFLFPSLVFAQGIVIKDRDSSTLAEVNSNGGVEVVGGKSSRASYTCSAGGLTSTALYNMSVESSAGTGFKLMRWCVGIPNATAAAAVTVTLQRRTTASTTGTLCTSEGTVANCSVSKHDPADGNYGGICRVTSTLGTAGAILDQQGQQIGELAAGTADPPGQTMVCKTYGNGSDEKPIVVLSGITNGISLNVSSPGAGALAAGSISMMIIAE